MVSTTNAAKEIRKVLKTAFPTTKFSVTSSRGSAVRINWTNGPTSELVELQVSKFEMGHFDGMTDCYDYSNRRDDIPQARYVFCNREIDQDIFNKAFELTKDYFGEFEGCTSLDDNMKQSMHYAWTPRERLSKLIQKIDLRQPLTFANFSI